MFSGEHVGRHCYLIVVLILLPFTQYTAEDRTKLFLLNFSLTSYFLYTIAYFSTIRYILGSFTSGKIYFP